MISFENDFEYLCICKHGRIAQIEDINKGIHRHISFWELIKLFF